MLDDVDAVTAVESDPDIDAVTAAESDPDARSEVAAFVAVSSVEDSPVEIVGSALPVGWKQPAAKAHARSAGRGFMVVRAIIDRPRGRLKVPGLVVVGRAPNHHSPRRR